MIAKKRNGVAVQADAPSTLRAMAASLFSGMDNVERKHMFAIDLARGIGALVVLFWHYQHFFYQGTQPRMTIPIEGQPLFGIFEPFYRYGHHAVEFFWLISGFVFAATYLGRRPSAAEFSVARLARLYPLHMITLVVVAFLQIASISLVGREQIYPYNDAYHFVLNVFFASSWGLEKGHSFNSPIWSVSVEIVVYVAFWMSVRFIFAFGIALPVIVAVVAFVIRSQLPFGDAMKFANCFMHFYIGVAVYLAYLVTKRRPLVISAIAAVILLAGTAIIYDGHVRIANGITLMLIGVLIGLCALEATTYGRRLERLRWIGDNTYGTYLWHVPVQIVILIAMDYFAISRGAAQNPLFLVGFLLVTIAIARLSFLRIELPLQRLIRTRMRSRGAVAERGAASA